MRRVLPVTLLCETVCCPGTVPAAARPTIPDSLNDHGPQHYISAITLDKVPNEFGDAYLIPAR
jgi:hypothetical protein